MSEPYKPTPRELRHRVKMTDLMRENGWKDEVAISIMVYSNPTLETVQRLIDRFGISGAYRRIQEIIEVNNSGNQRQGIREVVEGVADGEGGIRPSDGSLESADEEDEERLWMLDD